MKKITFRAEQRTQVAIAQPGETILDALLRTGAAVSFCCKVGLCGMCKSKLVSGDVEQLSFSVSALSKAEQQEGHVLICRARARSDCEILPLNPSGSAHVMSGRVIARVAGHADMNGSLVHVRLSLGAEQGAFPFIAGQYAQLEFSPSRALPAIRAFMASRPGNSHVDFYLPASDYSVSVAPLARGEEVLLNGPFGSAYLREDEAGPVVLIAESSGLPAATSILSELVVRLQARPVKVFLLGAARAAIERSILDLTHEVAGIDVCIREQWNDLAEMLTSDLHGLRNTPEGATPRVRAYVKGGHQITKAARKLLQEMGVRAWDVFADTAVSHIQ
jgi:CDP-4-dehydro-6-deoxyglucose reductase/ferredoxin-NAD(P)+ reductase (naphthalene dioxygenase ferredoxin-specific)